MERSGGKQAVCIYAVICITVLIVVPRFMDALFYAIDGNFHNNQKEKLFDPDDVPLSSGADYFADEKMFAAYSKTL